MTDLLISATHAFDAGHSVEGIPDCQHEHGHRFSITVTSQARIDPLRGSVPSLYELGHELELTCGELEGKSLNKMMSGSVPTGPHLALWVLERVAVNFPKITRVEVSTDPDHRYVVERVVR